MQNKSFTLIELLVVIVIIGILAGVIIVSVSSSINKANFAKAQSFSNTVQNELLGDLVSEWTFDSPAVANITEDTWGNNDGTLYGANGLPELQTKENCVYGTCYLFDGVDDYIDYGNPNVLNVPYITVSIWSKLMHSGITETFIAKESCFILRKYSNDNVQFVIFKTSSDWSYSNYSYNDINDGLWHHIVGTYDGNYIKLYVDGLEQGDPVLYSGMMPSMDSIFLIGSRNRTPSSLFNGLIDDVRIYKAALPSSQIKQQYVAGLDSLLANGSIDKEEYAERLNSLAQK